jgi:hypothetical protein
MSTVAYLGHPFGERDALNAWDNRRSDNVANALDWLKFLRLVTPWAICYPTVAYMAVLNEPAHEPRSFVDRVQIMLKCDLYVLTGGVMAPHMVFEQRAARGRPMPVMDLLHLGRLPPWDRKDEVMKEIQQLEDSLGI